jgi:Zn-dependent peptidase ImmA (M78 family)
MADPISAAALSQIEAGKVRPTDDTLHALAEALDVPVGFFFAQWPGGMSDNDTPAAYFRDLRATPARERRRALALALLLNDLVAAIEHHVRLPELRLTRQPVDVAAPREAMDDAAAAVRREWQLGLDPIGHVVREIERHGIPVARLSIGHHLVDAFSVAFDSRPIVLLTEDKSSYVRSRFDAAHELGHVVLHPDRITRDRTIESQAHSFAASFLLPNSVALEELPRRLDAAGWARLAELKRRWGVSMAALLRRGRDLRLLGEDDYRNAMKYMSSRGWRKQEPGDRELGPPESPLLIERALRTIEVNKDITAEELIESAHLPLRETMELVKAARDTRPVVEL